MEPAEALVHALLLGTPAVTSFLLFNGTLFSYHPVLMSLSYLAAMGEAVLMARVAAKKVADRKARADLLLKHGLLQAAAAVLATAGFAAIYVNKERMGKPHFTSWHGTVGLAVLLTSAGISLGGVVVYYRVLPSMKLLGLAKTAHRGGGAVALVAGAAAVATGLKPLDPAHPVNRGQMSYVLAIAALLGALMAGYGALAKRHRLPGGSKAE